MTAPGAEKKFEDVLREEGVLYYTIRGVSMLPLIRQESDLVVIRRPDRPLRKFDVVLFRRGNGQYVLHRILRVRSRDYVICGDNQWRKETGITDGQILGVMTGLLRGGEAVPLDTPAYRRYVFFRCGLFPLRAAYLWMKALLHRVARKLGGTRRGAAAPAGDPEAGQIDEAEN